MKFLWSSILFLSFGFNVLASENLIEVTKDNFKELKAPFKIRSSKDNEFITLSIDIDTADLNPELRVTSVMLTLSKPDQQEALKATAKGKLECQFVLTKSEISSSQCRVYIYSEAFGYITVYYMECGEMSKIAALQKR